MYGGYNYAYDKVAMPKIAACKSIEFYSSRTNRLSCSVYGMLRGRHALDAECGIECIERCTAPPPKDDHVAGRCEASEAVSECGVASG